MKIHKKEKQHTSKILRKVFKTTKLSKAKESFLEIADMPTYLQKNVTRITVIGNASLLIEQYNNILDYFNHYIRIKCMDFDLIVEGSELNIDEINNEELIIKGTILSMSYKK